MQTSPLPPQTTALLQAAQGDVFPAFAAGARLRTQTYLGAGGCSSDAFFDLASLTKVLGTTTLAAIAHEEGALPVDSRVRDFFPAFKDERVRLTHLLDHSSGLPWWLPLHAHFHDPDGPGRFDPKTTPPEARAFYEREIIHSHRPDEFEKRAEYSDLGMMLLGWILERVTSKPLDRLFAERVAAPLGLTTTYLPRAFAAPGVEIVPTEDCPWRKRVLRGEVHDDNCFVLGGVAAHAGLFGPVSDVLKVGEAWMRSWRGEAGPKTGLGIGLIRSDTARLFWTRSKVPSSTRALGWDSPSPPSSSGQFFGPAARGHLGFTGTSLWIDPEKELVAVLLTNRVHPTRANEKIRAFRPRFHDALLSELGLG